MGLPANDRVVIWFAGDVIECMKPSFYGDMRRRGGGVQQEEGLRLSLAMQWGCLWKESEK